MWVAIYELYIKSNDCVAPGIYYLLNMERKLPIMFQLFHVPNQTCNLGKSYIRNLTMSQS